MLKNNAELLRRIKLNFVNINTNRKQKKTKRYQQYVLMQICVLQSCDVVSVPGQEAPPYWGVGFVQVRVLDWVPPPQVTEQVP